MKTYNVAEAAFKNNGEYVLGSSELSTQVCYFVYGVLKQSEGQRLVKPGKGHEEIVCLIQGEVSLSGDKGSFCLKSGEAFHLAGDETFLMSNNRSEDAVYVISGGHSETHSH